MPKTKQEIIVDILKKKLTREPGVQPKVVHNPQMLEQRGAAGVYDPETHEIAVRKDSAPNVIAHELQHAIDVPQAVQASKVGVTLPRRPDNRSRFGHSPTEGELMSVLLTPGEPTDTQLAKEARGNLEARQAIMDQETRNWLREKMGAIGKIPGVGRAIAQSATTSREIIQPEKLIQDNPPVTFAEAVRQEMKKRKRK
jgi:hypothetical protein